MVWIPYWIDYGGCAVCTEVLWALWFLEEVEDFYLKLVYLKFRWMVIKRDKLHSRFLCDRSCYLKN
jgi:hypothetical protein